MKKVKTAILGAGNIAGRMAATLAESDCAELWAVASRSEEKAQTMAEKYGAAKYFGNYESLYADPDTELIYVATPHSFHYEQAKAALMAGKHVLCEKPMTVTAAQAEELFALAEQRGLLAAEAIWTRYLPSAETLLEQLKQGIIGDVTMIEARFGSDCRHIPRMTEPELAGGALLDLGVYCLTLFDMIFGADSRKVQTTGWLTEKGVDARSVTTLTYEGGRMAVMMTAMDTALGDSAMIYGSRGRIRLQPLYNWKEIVVYTPDGQISGCIPRPQQLTGFEYELAAVSKAIRAGALETEKVPREATLRIMRQMDQLRAVWQAAESL